MQNIIPFVLVLLLAFQSNHQTYAECCTWDFATCGESEWCNRNNENCEGPCNGSWFNPTNGDGDGSQTNTAIATTSTIDLETRSPTFPDFEFDLLSTSNSMSTWEIYQGLEYLTNYVQTNPPIFGLGSSGGAAGGVVSESQGYALLVTGIVLASWETHAQDRSDADRQEVIDAFEGYFRGWQRMCQKSSAPCQDQKYCEDSSGTRSVCLPGWKFSDSLSEEMGSGSAPDGDEDAITGMIYALKAVSGDVSKPLWYEEVNAWTDASITAFLQYDTISDDSQFRLVKLGSCWGGYGGSGNNPSYHSTGAYKLFRDFQETYRESSSSDYRRYGTSEWNKMIRTSYKVLEAVTCPDQGMVPNWTRIRKNGSGTELEIEPGWFSGSGTPQYEFGAEAARTIWRLALDAAAYPDDIASGSGPLLEPILNTLDRDLTSSWSQSTFPGCTTPGMSESLYIFSDWLNNEFIAGPVLSSLIVPSGSMTVSKRQALLDQAGTLLNNGSLPISYYSRCWILLANLAINGAIASASSTSLPKPSPLPQSPFWNFLSQMGVNEGQLAAIIKAFLTWAESIKDLFKS